MDRVGTVISKERRPPTHLNFEFYVEKEVTVGDFVVVPAMGGDIIAKVEVLEAYSSLFKEPEILRDERLYGLKMPSQMEVELSRIIVAKAKVLGVYDGIALNPPSIPPSPGEKVYKLPEHHLKRILNLSERGLYIGKIWGGSLKVVLDLDLTLRHHVAVLGATGTGKSYACGVIVEELLLKNIPVLIIDPHGEYWTLRNPSSNVKELESFELGPREFHTTVVSPSGNLRVSLKVSKIPAGALAEAANMSEVQEDLLYLAYKEYKPETLDELEKAVVKAGHERGFMDVTINSILRRIEALRELNIFSNQGVKLEKLLKPGSAVIMDLSQDMEERARRLLVGGLLLELFEARKRSLVPPFVVVVEEAHRFAPQDRETFSKTILRRIAREGRKFGVGLVIASQRIVGLDKDILSQCGTKILLRIDSATDLHFLNPLLEHTSFEDFRRLPHLPRGVAIITGVSLRFPVMVRIRPRMSAHGGGGESLWRSMRLVAQSRVEEN